MGVMIRLHHLYHLDVRPILLERGIGRSYVHTALAPTYERRR